MEDTSRADILRRIAGRVGTPTYVYFEERILEQTARLKELFDGVPGRLLYAMKANSQPAVLSTLRNQGIGIDAVSPAELLLALRLGFPGDQILFSANNMSDAEMQFAHRQGVLLNIGELSRLARYGEAFPGSSVCVRLNPQVGAGHHEHVITAGSLSKFGIPVSQASAVRRVLEQFDLQLVGLHQHIGSGIQDVDTLWTAIEVLLRASSEFPEPRFINLGGGLGIPYQPGETGLDLAAVRKLIGPRLSAFANERNVEIWFEPGRFFVAQAGVLLTQATTVKDNGDRVFVGLDSGMNHLVRPALYGSYHGIRNLTNPDGKPRCYDVVGNICETGDTFARDRQIAEVREDDLMIIEDTGAYGISMASEYNLRGRPAEVWVSQTETGRYDILQERASAAEIVNRTLGASRVPTHLQPATAEPSP